MASAVLLFLVLVFAGCASGFVRLACALGDEGWRPPALVAALAAGAAMVLAGLCLMAGVDAARAQEHEGHDLYHSAYRHWQQPGVYPPKSCCNAREVDWAADGTPLRVAGDCYPTEFRLVDGRRWIAKMDRYDRWMAHREWIDVPDDKILREKNPDESGRTGHICIGQGGEVLCARPPTGAL